MGKYIDVLLTKDGYFCVAPPWTVKVGDFVNLPDTLDGSDKLREIAAVSTDDVDGEHIKMIETYIGYPLPKITAKYFKSEVKWDVHND